MFKTIEEGLEIYRSSVKEYLSKCNEINSAHKKARDDAGLDYAGSLDWPKGDWEWKNQTEYRMGGMATALGLSREEVDEIWEEVKRTLKSTDD